LNTDLQMRKQMDSAERFIDKKFLENLQEYNVHPLSEYLKKHNLTRMYRIEKIVYDKNEDINEKLISVFHSVMPFCKNLVLILKGNVDSVDLYIGIRASQISNVMTAGSVFHDSFLGNFPGSMIHGIKNDEMTELVAGDSVNTKENIAYVNILPSEREKSNQENYIQGLEKFIDTMRGSEYICEILANPVPDFEIESRLNGFEELYSALFPFSKKTNSHGHNEGNTFTEGVTRNISDSISTGIAKATGKSDGYSHGKNSGLSMGILFGIGVSGGTNEGWTTGTNESISNTRTGTRTDGSGYQKSTSATSGTTDSMTIELRNKRIENLLEKLDRHMKRMKTGISYGIWEVSSYFISKEKKTAAIAASTYRSILLGEESGIEKANFTLFDGEERNTSIIRECLSFCEHPAFEVPDWGGDYGSQPNQLLSPTCYVNGKELALLFNLPRKSVNGITVTEMAEFGRNVLMTTNKKKRLIPVGHIYHMGQTESTPVALDLDSFSSHCFVTGSTGSGKSNTVYKLLEEVSKAPYNIPFLVVEPAKGEYRNEFRGVPGISLFSTNPQIDQMLKMNPFSFCKGIHVLEHLDRLVEIFNGCWEMYAAMPAILKEAMEEAYISKGWDLLNSVYIGDGEPEFPTFIDVLKELPEIINSSAYSSDTKGDYIGALVTRVNSMTNGIYGQIFCDEFEVDNGTLFDHPAVIDLSRVGSSETKSLIMGILVLKLTEYRMANAEQGNLNLRHLTVLEEAHNILKNSKTSQGSAGNNIVAKSVEMIVNSIAEMRTYGEGFVIVDQSPTSVDISAIKNTNTKIIMRLPEEEDCKIAGHAVSLSENQVSELAKLETGVAVVMQNNWTEPVLSKINASEHLFEENEKRVSFEQLKAFRSMILQELIEQYEITDEQNIEEIMQKVEQFEISSAKKAEMKRMLVRFDRTMKGGYDSIFFGRTMLRLIGCDDAFKKAEKMLRHVEDADGNLKRDYTEKSLGAWYRCIEDAMPQYIFVDNQNLEIVRQYILHAKKFENHAVDYSMLYQQIYKNIK